MSDQNLTLPICGTFIFLLTLVTVILGMQARLRFGKRLLGAYKDKEKINNWLKSYGNKHKLLVTIALVSILGILVIAVLVFSGIMVMSKLFLILLVVFILLAIISGALILIDVEKLA